MRALGLGPIEVWVGGDQVNLGGPKPRTLLTTLLLAPRQTVSVERLIDVVWDESPPQTASGLVHTYISSLRRVLDKALVTHGPGYLLDIGPEDNDVERFGAEVAAARRAEHDGEHDIAIARYRAALGLWRGPALHGVEARFIRTQAHALEEARLTTEEALCRCELAVGQVDDVIARLSSVASAHPAREETRELLMRALYQAGRQADALAVYQDTRVHLLEQLGIEPGERLRELQVRILNATLPVVSARPAKATPARLAADDRVVPHHLPPDISDFMGREEALAHVLGLADGESTGTATPTVVVSGFGGAGKSALAVRAAHLLRKSYPDGQLFADLRGAGRDLGAHEVLGRFLALLGVPGPDQPDAPDERLELYRRTVADRRLVIVLDNARNEQQVRGLLPGNPRCFVIITSRSRLTGLEGASPLELGFLPLDVAGQMLGRIAGEDRVAVEPDAARRIAELCGGVPLALRAAGAKLLARPHWPLKTLAKRLSDERRRLDELTIGDLAIRSSLRLNYAELDDPHRRAFHLLSLLDLPDFGSWVVAPLLDIPPDDAEDMVEHLVELRLVDVSGVDEVGRVRYRFHDLVQLFGAEQAAVEEATVDVTAAVERTLAVWMGLVETGARRLPRVTLGLRPRSSVEVRVDPRLAEVVEEDPIGWLHSETPAVVRAVERAQELGVDEMTTTLITTLLSSPFAARNEFGGWQRTHEVALESARSRGNRWAEAVLLTGLGQLRYEQDDFDSALRHFQQAVDFATEVEDTGTLAVALVGLGTVRRDLAEFDAARVLLDRAVGLGDAGVVAAASYGIGAIHRDHGDFTAALEALARSERLYRELDDQRGVALALRGLSLCHRAVGEQREAVALSRQAQQVLHEVGDELGAAYAAQSLAKALFRSGEVDGVADLLDSCVEVCARQHDRFGVALMTRTKGEFALSRGRLADARALLSDALAQWRELGLSIWRARTLRDLAAASADEGLWQETTTLCAELGIREAREMAGSMAADHARAVRL